MKELSPTKECNGNLKKQCDSQLLYNIERKQHWLVDYNDNE